MARGQRPTRALVALVRRVLLAVCALAVLIVGVANVVTVATTRDRVVTVEGAARALAGDAADAVVVLGASVYAGQGHSQATFSGRSAGSGLRLVQSGAARAIIVSGDNRTSHYNESDAMKAYCVELGVPSEDVYVDHAGNTTYESMWRARHVLGQGIIVATQAYHLYRAMFAADCLGMQVWGVPCDKGAYDNQRAYSIREVLARTKDFYAALLRLPVDTAGEAVSLND